VREVCEELGVTATVEALVTATAHRGRRHVTLYYRATITGTPIADGVEVEGWRYVPVAEAERLLGAEARAWLPVTVLPQAA
jgi:hypothetical protein